MGIPQLNPHNTLCIPTSRRATEATWGNTVNDSIESCIYTHGECNKLGAYSMGKIEIESLQSQLCTYTYVGHVRCQQSLSI